MTARHNQKALEDMGDPRPGSDGEYYHPTESDRERGRWAVVFERLDADGVPDIESMAHIIPIFDTRPHRISVDCWCDPKRSGKTKETWNHNLSQ